MRVVIATMLILIIFFTGVFILNGYINRSCESLLNKIDGLNQFIMKEEWAEAIDGFESLKEEWQQTKKTWQLFLEHYEMDAIDIALVRLEQYLGIGEKALSLGEISELRLLVAHIRSKEGLRLENIL